LLTEGEEIAGESRVSHATTELNAAAAECAATSGCEMRRFLSVFDELLGRQSLAIKQQAYRIETFEEIAALDVEREPGTSAFVEVMPEMEHTVSLLRGTDLREIIDLNGPVSAALDDWLTWMRPMLMAAYENYQYLRDDIAPIYEEAGLPEALLFAMIATESGGKVHAFSRAGAAGPLQFMSRTGRRYGLTEIDGFDTRLDPAAATRANVAYLNDQFAVLNDNLAKALAAYNGGENRMKGLNRRLGGASLWDSRMFYSLPRETREYVPRVLAAAWLFLHPEDYDLEFPILDVRKAMLRVEDDIAIGELAVCLGQEHNANGWFRTLRNLNPRLGPGERVEAGEEIVVPEILLEVYERRCLDGDLLARARELHDANYPDGGEMIPYVVQRGDTLGKIASRHRCVSVGELAAINGIRAPKYVIRVGQNLQIPRCG
ncbi:MAG: transglycosylase SLT domain-containing protein, partial [Acidobacteriota bacterium]|nr:transglycosylase SLT domain-containing protein [Acidobacteriota bacterium]